MDNAKTHRKKCPFRWWSAVSLAIVYLSIVMSPLSSLALHSKMVAHAVTGECSGDCDVCGCSPESRANHTCCCAKKKQNQANAAGIITGSCCSPKGAAVDHKKACCSKPAQKTGSTKTETVYKCNCPCGKGKLLSLTGFGSNELIPVASSETLQPLHAETFFTNLSNRLASRHGEPPDPPPRLQLLS